MESLQLEVPEPYELDKSVLSYGFSILAPNVWRLEADGQLGVLQRVLTLKDGTHVAIRISQLRSTPGNPSHRPVTLAYPASGLSPGHRQEVLQQVKRMLRLGDQVEEDILAAFRRMHLPAAAQGWGRLYRSPNLWEDVVKTLLLCSCGWGRTVSMSSRLCALTQGVQPVGATTGAGTEPAGPANSILPAQTPDDISPADGFSPQSAAAAAAAGGGGGGGALNSNSSGGGTNAAGGTALIHAFPSPQDVLTWGAPRLQAECGVGYRAARLVSLAHMFAGGCVDEGELTQLAGTVRVAHLQAAASHAAGADVGTAGSDMPANVAAGPGIVAAGTCEQGAGEALEQLRARLLALPGIGPYAANNLLQALGVYSHIPADSETARHMRQVHRVPCEVKTSEAAVTKVYGRYAPFSFLAYWYELWHEYQALTSTKCFATLPPEEYTIFTGARMRRGASEGGPPTPEKAPAPQAGSRKRRK